MKYDDTSLHRGNGFREDFVAVNTALFVKWCLSRDLGDPEWWEGDEDAIKKLVAGEMSANAFYEKYCDEKFFSEMLTEEGNDFAEAYFDVSTLDDRVAYYDDFSKIEQKATAGEDFYEDYDEESDELPNFAPEEKIDYEELASVIDKRFADFQAQKAAAREARANKRPWYKFW